MLIEHRGARPQVHPSAYVAPTAVLVLATGAALFPGARVGAGAEVRINGVVHVNTVLDPGATVPIGWVAVGDPARILPPDRHEEIWAIQRELDFPGTTYGAPRGTDATTLMRAQAEWYGAHREYRVLPER